MNDHSTSVPVELSLVAESGKGRPFIILYESGGDYKGLAELVHAQLTPRNRVLLISMSTVSATNWALLTERLLTLVADKGIRSASIIAAGEAASVAQALALRELKLVRTLVLVNATTRPHPSFRARVIQRIERLLPLGLPFRSDIEGFDSKPLLQRIRCPVLVVLTAGASAYTHNQADELLTGLPTAWRLVLGGENESAELTDAIEDFQEIPAKCPQRPAA